MKRKGKSSGEFECRILEYDRKCVSTFVINFAVGDVILFFGAKHRVMRVVATLDHGNTKVYLGKVPGVPSLFIESHGDSGLLVRVGRNIDEHALALVSQLKRAVEGADVAGVRDVIAAYTSLLVVFDPAVTDVGRLARRINDAVVTADSGIRCPRRWRIPVAYGGRHGIDLAQAADRCGMSPERLVETHAGHGYRVAMFGFLPGFAYLAGLPAEIAIPRRETPRLRVPPGIIAIGGAQTAIGSVEGPSGWHIIGRTPVVTFDPARNPVTFLAPGDEIRFEPINEARFEALSGSLGWGDLPVERSA